MAREIGSAVLPSPTRGARRSARRADYLFVYGTLMVPARLGAVVGDVSRCRGVGRATVRAVLYHAGAYPALRPSRSPHDRVPGLLVELSEPARALALLDLYEGVPEGLYTRRRCRARLGDGQAQTAWVYVYARSVAGMRRIEAWRGE